MKTSKILLSLAVALALGGSAAHVAPIMFVHDSNGNLGKVDVVSSDVDVIGTWAT